MIVIATVIHFFTVAATTACSTLGVAIGQGLATRAALESINRQPAAEPDIARSTLLSLALIETGAMLGLLISFLLFFNVPPTLYGSIGQLGVGLAIAIPALFTGYSSSLPAREAFGAIARQPFFAKKIRNFMLLSQSLIQTPLIFGFVIALALQGRVPSTTTLSQALTLIASGLAIGLGSVGPTLGGGNFTAQACKSIGLNKAAYTKLFTFTFLSQAIIETPVIFASIISLILASPTMVVGDHYLIGLAYLTFASTIAFGTLGAGISSGRIAATAALQIGSNPELYTLISRASMLAQGLVDTIPIYAFIISLWLILTPLG